jgi:Rod binding domain-containing protein
LSLPIAPASQLSSSPPEKKGEHPTEAQERLARKMMGMQWGASALTAPQTPSIRNPEVDRSKVDPQIVQAAEGMETMFLDYMMKVMRQTVPKNEMDMENPATEIYQGMLDSEYAEKAAHAGGVGLSDTIIAYMAPDSYNLKSNRPSESASPTEWSGTKRSKP